MANENQMHYIVKFTAEGKPEIVEISEEVRKSGEAVVETEKKLGRVVEKVGPTVNEQTARAREIMKKRREEAVQMAEDVTRVSEAERNLELTMREASEALKENSFFLEAARLEYEQGEVSQEEYIAELQRLQAELKNIDAPSVQLIRRQRQINKELQRMNPEMQNNVTTTRSANSAMFALTSGLSRLDPQIGGTATTVLSMTRSMSSMTARSGGALNMMKSLTAFATSPGGMIAVFSLVATGIGIVVNKLELLEDQGRDTEGSAKDLVGQLRDLNKELINLRDLGDVEGLLQEERMLSLVEEDIKDQMRALEEAAAFRGTFAEGLGGTGEQLMSDEQREQYNQLKEDLEAVGEAIDEVNSKRRAAQRMEDLPTVQGTEDEIASEEERKEWEEQLADWDQQAQGIRDKLEILSAEDIEIIEIDVETREEELAELDKLAEDRIKAQGKRRMQFERELAEMELQVRMNQADEIGALEIEKQHRIQQIRDDELLTTRQRQQAITLIEAEYAQRREEIARREAEQKKQLAEEEKMARIDSAAAVTSALQGFGSVIAGDSEENAREQFEANKAFNYAAAVMNTAAAITEALSNPIRVASVSAIGAIQIAKIAATKFRGASSGSGSGANIGYRGFDTGGQSFENPINNAGRTRDRERTESERSERQEVRRIILEDGFRNIVSRGREEIDRSGGSNYLRGD